jgi:hypothetical protein
MISGSIADFNLLSSGRWCKCRLNVLGRYLDPPEYYGATVLMAPTASAGPVGADNRQAAQASAPVAAMNSDVADERRNPLMLLTMEIEVPQV